ncbi:3-methylornithine synthase [uncultured archaeon]|nr:3-methylornithine synthase [uncultured archaeon]
MNDIIDEAIASPSEASIANVLAFAGQDQLELFELAKRLKGDRIFVRAEILPSNYCRQNCLYCGNRRDNGAMKRYRITGRALSDVTDAALAIPEVDFVSYLMSEDPGYPFDQLCEEIRKVYAAGKRVNLGLGDVPAEVLRKLHDAAGGEPIKYTLKIESGDADHFRRVKDGYKLSARIDALRRAINAGFEPCSGIIVGLPGQDTCMIARDLMFLKDFPGLAQASASVFSPIRNTPFGAFPKGNESTAFNFLALLRILRNDRNLTTPISLYMSQEGRLAALEYFADTVTVEMMPAQRLPKFPFSIFDRAAGSYNRIPPQIRRRVDELSLELNNCRWHERY